MQTRKLEHPRRFVTEFTASVLTRNLLGDEKILVESPTVSHILKTLMCFKHIAKYM